MKEHVHDCTGPDMTCQCGYAFRVPPICVSIEVTNRSSVVVSDGFNCETLAGAIGGLERAIRKLKAEMTP